MQIFLAQNSLISIHLVFIALIFVVFYFTHTNCFLVLQMISLDPNILAMIRIGNYKKDRSLQQRVTNEKRSNSRIPLPSLWARKALLEQDIFRLMCWRWAGWSLWREQRRVGHQSRDQRRQGEGALVGSPLQTDFQSCAQALHAKSGGLVRVWRTWPRVCILDKQLCFCVLYSTVPCRVQ